MATIADIAGFLEPEIVRENLRLDPDDDDGEAMLDRQLRSAVAAIEDRTGRAVFRRVGEMIVRAQQVYWRGGFLPAEQLTLDLPDVAAVVLKTWPAGPPADGSWSDPTVAVEPSRVYLQPMRTVLWPPAGGWPEWPMQAKITCGMDDASRSMEIARQAAVVFVRTAFNGATAPAEDAAFTRLIEPLRFAGTPGLAALAEAPA